MVFDDNDLAHCGQPLYVVSDYRVFAPHEYHITRTIHEYVLLIMFDGVLTFTENDVEITLKAGEWYLQKPNLRQSAVCESQCPSYYYVHFLLPSEQENQNDAFFKKLTRGKCDYKLYESFFRELSLPLGHSVTDIFERQALFLNFLSFFLKTCGIDYLKQNSKPVQNVINYLKLNYTGEINLETIAEQFHYSAGYLHKLFKKETGITTPTYVKNLRLEKAVILLQNTNTPIADIAGEIGYEDPSVFFRNFKSRYGLSPSAFRQRYLTQHRCAFKNPGAK